MLSLRSTLNALRYWFKVQSSKFSAYCLLFLTHPCPLRGGEFRAQATFTVYLYALRSTLNALRHWFMVQSSKFSAYCLLLTVFNPPLPPPGRGIPRTGHLCGLPLRSTLNALRSTLYAIGSRFKVQSSLLTAYCLLFLTHPCPLLGGEFRARATFTLYLYALRSTLYACFLPIPKYSNPCFLISAGS
jgi:hypothetical protein